MSSLCTATVVHFVWASRVTSRSGQDSWSIVGGGGVKKQADDHHHWASNTFAVLGGLSLRAAASQSSPSRSPSPVVVVQGCTCHSLCFNRFRWSLSVTSLAVKTLAKSCLFAKTRSFASVSSELFSSLWSSSLASEIRSLSLLSTTKIKPCTCAKNRITWRLKTWTCTHTSWPENPNCGRRFEEFQTESKF